MRFLSLRAAGAIVLAASLVVPGCGGSSSSPENPVAVVPTPAPTPTPTPTPAAPTACQLTAPTVDCAERRVQPLELAEPIQAALDVAMGAPGAMYGEYTNRIYDLDLFRSRVVGHLGAAGLCAVWDYGNERGDEIFVRSADGCVVEQYDLIAGDGGVRSPNRNSQAWSDGWGAPVPGPKPQFSREGDLQCSLPGDRATFCFGIRGSQGEFGVRLYDLIAQVINENPQLVDKNDTLPGQGESDPAGLKFAAWRITDQNAYIAAVERKIRGAGFCGFVDRGDILIVKQLALGNVFHEEFDIVQNPVAGGSYTFFLVKDRCHNAGF